MSTSTVELRVLAEPCDGCPFKGRLDLRSGRLKDIMQRCESGDRPFTATKP